MCSTETFLGAFEPPGWVLSVFRESKSQSAEFKGFPAEFFTESISIVFKIRKIRLYGLFKGGFDRFKLPGNFFKILKLKNKQKPVE